MKGDFTRLNHEPRKRYTAVLEQQGRVRLDADANEATFTQAYLARTQAIDVIGPCGAPKGDGANFQVLSVTADGSNLNLGLGRIYVDGILCQLEDNTQGSYLTQSDYPDPPALSPVADQTHLVYLDVWERHVTAIEDPDIREVALGGPDTTTRLQTVWQVKVETTPTAANGDEALSCDNVALPTASDGRLSTTANEPEDSSDPCIVPAGGGYRGLENRLYRVEIHEGGDLGAGDPVTFKWSRDNGAIVFAVEAFNVNNDDSQLRMQRLGRDQVFAFHKDDWVEILDDDTELRGEPGTIAQIVDIKAAERVLVLSQSITGYDVAKHARMRRWDHSTGQPAAPVTVVTGSAIALEDGIEITFSGNTFKSGDYWVFAARTATRPGLDELDEAPPYGIQHHYCPLALITWQQDAESGWDSETVIDDCRPQFPPLSNICAEDVCFDNSDCQLPGAATIQDALDQLCAANDLRHHNKHLHGWGIVCGLQVQCGDASHVTIRDGYAIDCEGNDLILETENDQGLSFNLMQAIADYEGEHPDDPIIVDGSGDACLVLNAEEGEIVIRVEPYDPTLNTLQAKLSGTLLMDFYNNCILRLVDFLQEQLNPPTDEPGSLVSEGQKRLTTFSNLFIQLYNPTYGHRVFLSLKEHEILRSFYDGLREILQSKTFCAMFKNARPFPDYPFTEEDDFTEGSVSTVFGKGYHTRLRVNPEGTLGYTIGFDQRLHIYDLATEEMVAESDIPGGTGIVARDVAFSADGRQLYAIATIQDADTIFAIADVEGSNLTWRPITIICDVKLMTLAMVPSLSNMVYATGHGQGLYTIDPAKVTPNIQPSFQFNAVGHLVINEAQNVAYASAFQGEGGADSYNSVARIDLSAGGFSIFQLVDAGGVPLTGSDDIAVVTAGDQVWLLVVTDAATGSNSANKQLIRLQANEPDDRPVPEDIVDLEENTEVRLGHVPGSNYLLLSFEDSYRIRFVNLSSADALQLDSAYSFPVQISPLAIAAAANAERVYILNNLSSTITTTPAVYLNPDNQLAPGSQAFMEDLHVYRDGMFNAFTDLLGGLLQYLKDCLCDHFLVNCPQCDEDDKIYLGCASVREGEVDHVCNFSQRRYVKSFPTVGYWLSLVPVASIIDFAVEQMCCAILPRYFSTLASPTVSAYNTPYKGAQMRQGLTYALTTDFRALFNEFSSQFNLSARQKASGQMNKAMARLTAPPGARTMSVAPAEPGGQAISPAEVETLKATISQMEAELKELRSFREEVRRFMEARP